jgi:hypothetical protein
MGAFTQASPITRALPRRLRLKDKCLNSSASGNSCSEYSELFPAGRWIADVQHKISRDQAARARSTVDCSSEQRLIEACLTKRGYDPTSERDTVLVSECARLAQAGCFKTP